MCADSWSPRNLLVSRPFYTVAIDFTILEKDNRGFENVLVVIDMVSKLTFIVPINDREASTVARVLVEKWFLYVSIPQNLHSCQGRNFVKCMILRR